MRRIAFLIVLVTLAGGLAACAGVLRGNRHAGQPVDPVVVAYIDSVFVLMRERALAEHPVDWDALRLETLRRAGGAKTPADAHPALEWALKTVNPHSALLLPDRWAELERRWRESPSFPTGLMLGDRIAYIALPAFSSQVDYMIQDYAVRGQDLIRRLRDQGACGWILDLRRNTGGHMYAMVVAIGPLLGEGNAGFFRAGAGLIQAWGYAHGAAWLGPDTMARLPRDHPPVPPLEAPVAILMGPLTASSAEGIVAGFRGVPQTLTFGAATAGFSTGNTGYRLSDGATVLLTELVLGDRLGQEYGHPIRPDRRIGGGLWNMFADPEDRLTTAAAADWLRNMPECRLKRAGKP